MDNSTSIQIESETSSQSGRFINTIQKIGLYFWIIISYLAMIANIAFPFIIILCYVIPNVEDGWNQKCLNKTQNLEDICKMKIDKEMIRLDIFACLSLIILNAVAVSGINSYFIKNTPTKFIECLTIIFANIMYFSPNVILCVLTHYDFFLTHNSTIFGFFVIVFGVPCILFIMLSLVVYLIYNTGLYIYTSFKKCCQKSSEESVIILIDTVYKNHQIHHNIN